MTTIPAPPEDEFLAEIIKVPVSDLFVDHRYQRGVKKSSVKNLVEHWSWKRYIPIIVSHRREDGHDRFVVIDGQQRTLASQELGIPWLPAVLIVARSVEDEAERFVGANTGVAVGAGDRFRAEYLRREPRYVRIAEEVKLAGFELACVSDTPRSAAGAPYLLEAAHTVEALYDRGYLVRVLTLIAQVWGAAPDRDMAQGAYLDGVYLMLKHLDRFEVPNEEIVTSLRGMAVREVMDRGYERYKSMLTSRSIPGGIAAVLVERFNYRKPANRAVPAYDRSAARSNAAYYGSRTLRQNPDYKPWGGVDPEELWRRRMETYQTDEFKERMREQAAQAPRSGGRFVRRR